MKLRGVSTCFKGHDYLSVLLEQQIVLPFHHLYELMPCRSIVWMMLYCTTLHCAMRCAVLCCVVQYSAVLCSGEDKGAPLYTLWMVNLLHTTLRS